MSPPARRAPLSVLILKADRLYAQMLRTSTLTECPRAHVTVVHTIEDAFRVVGENDFDLVLTGVGTALKGDALEFISCCSGNPGQETRALVVSTHLEQRIVITLHALGVAGVFDAAHDDPANFPLAIRAVLSADSYWSTAATERLRTAATSLLSPSRVLTAAEQLILSIVGDGCDDEVAAVKLGLRSSTVSTVRRELHRKLGVKHRGELIRIALLNGFVRFTEDGVLRPGFAQLHAAYEAARRRRVLGKAA